MAKVRKRHLALLRPFLVGEQPRPNGEWDMYCPLHEDAKRSAQVNVKTGVWFCHAGCGGGRVSQLILKRRDWVDPETSRNGSAPTSRRSGRGGEKITEAKAAGWAAALQSNDEALDELMEQRGLTNEIIKRYEIGWDSAKSVYTIPVWDEDGELVNVRRYDMHPKGDRRKIWGVTGRNAPRLYPLAVFDDDPGAVVICEGEWDALATIEHGYPAITRTAAAKTWEAGWGSFFQDRVVYLAHDSDETGQDANRKVGRALQRAASEVRVLHLPYPIEKKHGKDLTDFWLEHGKGDFDRLLREAPLFGESEQALETIAPDDASVLDSFDASRVGRPLRLTVTIKGKRDPGYSVPKTVHYECTRDAGDKCNLCPLNAAGGDDKLDIAANDPAILELMESTKIQMLETLRNRYGTPKCPKLEITVDEHQSVEVLYARPSVDHASGAEASDYKNLKITSVGRHDTLPNNTVQVIGALQPDPRKQLNEFMAWEVNRLETSLDRFEVNARTMRLLRRFQPATGQRPLAKLAQISKDLANHVTKIYGRPEMHAAMDLAFHSALGFDFSGQRVDRGWIDLLLVGDTRTGKSEAANRLVKHYGAGEMISCESASFAGIVGGLQQYGSGKEWAISWGIIPINDRRLVVLDEIGGLTPEEIGQMSDVRSSGMAKLTKIQQEATFARTRLIWMGNPRSARMSDYTYGVQAIRPLIGNNEDVARFDLAMGLVAGEVAPGTINMAHHAGRLRYTEEACRALVRWVWSRTPDQVVWARGAEENVFKLAGEMGARYVEDPPLVQAANIRVKIARVAVALAARTFSTDKTGEKIVVGPRHVQDAVAFMDRLYSMPNFGYAERSAEMLGDEKEAKRRMGEIKKYLRSRKGLAKFLRSVGKFRRSDLEEILNISREEANAIINKLWDARMVRKEAGDVRVEPTLHALLREVRS